MSTDTLPQSSEPALTPKPAGGPMPFRTPTSMSRIWRGPVEDAPWVRPAFLGLLVITAVLYLWDLGASGWANSFYSAAAQAGSASWKAFFFGSSDAANSITVDKTPMSLWAMGLSVRVFGLSSWSILAPQALMGVGSVALLYATVRRTPVSAGAGLLAGAILAATPVAALMFRFNNPDALLVLLLIGSVAATVRAIEATKVGASPDRKARNAVRWLAVAGALVGFAFLTKMLQAFLVLPGLAVVYFLAADTSVARRLKHLLVAFASMIVAAGWWIAIVSVWPAASRPFIGGSQHNSILELTLGYNGLGRITGDETGSIGGGGGWGATGLLRMFNSEIGGQISWLLPAALILGAAGLWVTRRAPRTDLTRAGLIVWGGWLLVTGLTFSLMQGIFHPYYTVVLAPAIAALVAIGATLLWRRRASYGAALTLAGSVAITASLGFFLLNRSSDYLPWLKWLVVIAGLGSAVLLGCVRHVPRRAAFGVAAVALAASIVGPASYSISTAAQPHSGAIPSAGPTSSFGGPRGAMGAPLGLTAGLTRTAPGGTAGPVLPGGLLTGSTSSPEITALLTANADDYTWVAAAVGSNTAAGYQLSSQDPVMAIGGFNGTDPSPTLAQFQTLVEQGRIHYFIEGGTGGFGFGFPLGVLSPGGMSLSVDLASDISSWVSENFTAQTVDGVTLYDLSAGLQ